MADHYQIIRAGPLLNRMARLHVDQAGVGFRRVDDHDPPLVEMRLKAEGLWYPMYAEEFDRAVARIKKSR